MFLGEYKHIIDTKKRLAIPAKFRRALGKNAVITRGLDNCLFVFTGAEWKKLADKISALPLGQRDARGFARLMLAGAAEASMDSLGRILIPDYLKNYASLGKQVVITGIANRIEIWDELAWETYKDRSERNADKLAETMGELGI
jgi:MraZ protein